jgi:PhzF family phenazine biosynthesis protein
MKLPIFQVDAFAEELFQGNPAAVIPLEEWLPDGLMQSVAMENNLSETAFFVQTKAGFEIRWFTPKAEVDLCGHATLATAHVIFSEAYYPKEKISFGSRSGLLKVKKENDLLQLNFPADVVKQIEAPKDIVNAVGLIPTECFQGKTDYLFVYQTEKEIRELRPDFSALAKTKARGIIVTAPGDGCDFVSRFFAPAVGIDEDPVTGSAHTVLTPYWAEKLGKTNFSAQQVSARGGKLECALKDDRVLIAGRAKTYLHGEIYI